MDEVKDKLRVFNSCKYCNGEDKQMPVNQGSFTGDTLYVGLHGNVLEIESQTDHRMDSGEVEINYCPVCGRSLKI